MTTTMTVEQALRARQWTHFPLPRDSRLAWRRCHCGLPLLRCKTYRRMRAVLRHVDN